MQKAHFCEPIVELQEIFELKSYVAKEKKNIFTEWFQFSGFFSVESYIPHLAVHSSISTSQ